MLNHASVFTVDACDFGPGTYRDNTVNFTATVSPWILRFEFEVGKTTGVVKVDNGTFIFRAKSSYPGSRHESRDIFWERKAPNSPSACLITQALALKKGR